MACTDITWLHGASGRSTIDILKDAVRSIAALHTRGGSSSSFSLSNHAGSETTSESDTPLPDVCAAEPRPVHCPLPFRESLFNADSLMCMEVVVFGDLDSSDWIINDLGCGAQNFYMHNFANDVRGHSLKHFLHPDDMHTLLWLRREVDHCSLVACSTEQAASAQVRFLDRRQDLHGSLEDSQDDAPEYATLTLQLLRLPSAPSSSSEAGAPVSSRLLLTGALPPHVVQYSKQQMREPLKCFVEPELGVTEMMLWDFSRCVGMASLVAHVSEQQDFKVSLDEQHISWLGSFADEELDFCSSSRCADF